MNPSFPHFEDGLETQTSQPFSIFSASFRILWLCLLFWWRYKWCFETQNTVSLQWSYNPQPSNASFFSSYVGHLCSFMFYLDAFLGHIYSLVILINKGYTCHRKWLFKSSPTRLNIEIHLRFVFYGDLFPLIVENWVLHWFATLLKYAILFQMSVMT